LTAPVGWGMVGVGHRRAVVSRGARVAPRVAGDGAARSALGPQADLAAGFALQLLVSQRADGALTVGDTHRHVEPFDFALDERPYAELAQRVERLLGGTMPPIVRRWSGVYSQHTGGAICHRAEPLAGVLVVTGPGGRGMSLAPAIAEETFVQLDAS